MLWVRTRRGMLVANLGAYRGVVERPENDRTWSARVEAPDQVYHSAFDYPSMNRGAGMGGTENRELTASPTLHAMIVTADKRANPTFRPTSVPHRASPSAAPIHALPA